MSDLNIGMVGLDTSHCEAIVGTLNYPDAPHHVPGGRVTAAFPGGSDLTSVSRDRVEGFTGKLRDEHGIAMCGSLEELGPQVDAFLLTSVDGRQHLDQFRVLSKFGKPVFIDKPLACSHADAKEIAEMAALTGTPVMSASAIRYSAGVVDLVPEGETVGSCEAFGAMPILDDYPTYFWYAVHGADWVFAQMGRGCRQVRAIHSDDADLLVGEWDGGRIGTVRGCRFASYHFGATVFTDAGTHFGLAANDPPGHVLLLQRVMPFLQGGKPAVDLAETVEEMAFLEAAEESLAQDGDAVPLPA